MTMTKNDFIDKYLHDAEEMLSSPTLSEAQCGAIIEIVGDTLRVRNELPVVVRKLLTPTIIEAALADIVVRISELQKAFKILKEVTDSDYAILMLSRDRIECQRLCVNHLLEDFEEYFDSVEQKAKILKWFGPIESMLSKLDVLLLNLYSKNTFEAAHKVFVEDIMCAANAEFIDFKKFWWLF